MSSSYESMKREHINEILLMHYCERSDRDSVVKLFIDNDNIDLTYEDGGCFLIAIKRDDLNVLSLLLEYYKKTKLGGDYTSQTYKEAKAQLRIILNRAFHSFAISSEVAAVAAEYLYDFTVYDEIETQPMDLIEAETKLRSLIEENYLFDKYNIYDWGRNLLMFAVRYLPEKAVDALLDDIKMLKLDKRLIVFERADYSGRNALMLAIRYLTGHSGLSCVAKLINAIMEFPIGSKKRILEKKDRYSENAISLAEAHMKEVVARLKVLISEPSIVAGSAIDSHKLIDGEVGETEASGDAADPHTNSGVLRPVRFAPPCAGRAHSGAVDPDASDTRLACGEGRATLKAG